MPKMSRLFQKPQHLFVALLLMACGLPTAGFAQDDETTDPRAERQQRMQERRAERQKMAEERRQRMNDPEYLREQAWWNQEDNVSDFSLTQAQRKKADAAFASFVGSREARQEALQSAQTAFFEALGNGARDVEAKKQAMIDAMAANTAANADLRIAVIGTLSGDQRAKIAEEQPRLLRSNWTQPQRGRDRMPRRQRTP